MTLDQSTIVSQVQSWSFLFTSMEGAVFVKGQPQDVEKFAHGPTQGILHPSIPIL